MAELFGWRRSLDATFAHAPRFYWTVVASLVAGTALAFLPVGPIPLLFFAGIAGGIATPVTLALLTRVATDARIMKGYRIGAPLAAAGWAVTAFVSVAAAVYLVSLHG